MITLPRERAFGPVAGLVLGGVAARHDLTLDVLDDLQLALETLLDHEESESEVRIVLRVDETTIGATIGPFDGTAVLELEQEQGETLGVRRLLDTVVDSVEIERRDGGYWVELSKSYLAAGSV